MRDTTRTCLWAKALSFDTSGNSTTTLVQSVLGGQTYRLLSTVDCGVAFAATSTNDGTSFVVQAGTPEYIDGTGIAISAKGLTASGTLYIACMGAN